MSVTTERLLMFLRKSEQAITYNIESAIITEELAVSMALIPYPVTLILITIAANRTGSLLQKIATFSTLDLKMV